MRNLFVFTVYINVAKIILRERKKNYKKSITIKTKGNTKTTIQLKKYHQGWTGKTKYAIYFLSNSNIASMYTKNQVYVASSPKSAGKNTKIIIKVKTTRKVNIKFYLIGKKERKRTK